MWWGGLQAHAAPEKPEVVLGVLSLRNAAATAQTYASVVQHLQEALPNQRVRLAPLPWDELDRAVQATQLDFVLTNGVQYVSLRHRNALSGALVTQRIHESGSRVSTRGAVVLRQASRTDLSDFSLLHSRKLTVALPALHHQGMLSYLAPMVELAQAGVGTGDWHWKETGRAQHKVIDAVLQGQADLGFVRTGLIEELEQSGQLAPGRLAVVNPKPGLGYPVHLSTALYPEWALAALPHVDEATSRTLTAALLSMDLSGPGEDDTRVTGFTIPADYGTLEDHMRLLRMSPFDRAPQLTWVDIWAQYRWTLVALMAVTAGMLVSLLALWRVHRARTVVMNNMSDGFVRVDLTWRCRMVNRKAAEWLGRPVRKLVGQDMWAVFPPELGQRYEAIYRQAMATGQPHTIDMQLAQTDRWFENRLQPDDQGLSVFLTDISERKRQEEKLRHSETRNRAIVSALPDLLFRLDAQGTVLDFQTGNPQDLLLPPSAFLNRRIADILPSTVAQPAMAALANALAGQPDVRLEYALPLPQGEQHFEMRMVKIAANEVLGISRNVTDRLRAQETQRLAASVFDTANEGIFITDATLHIVQVNPAFTHITGLNVDEVLGLDLTRLGLDANEDTYRELLRTLQHHGEWKGEVWSRRKNGEVFMARLSLTALANPKGQIGHHVGVFSDVSALKAHEEEMLHIAYHDALTGLPNRRLLADQMKVAVSRALRGERFMAVCYFDLDDFKHINDAHGHEAGDQVLTTVARRLQAELRAEDTLARLGGDEFVALISDLENVSECEALAQRLLTAVGGAIDLGHTVVRVTASIGIALYPQDDVSPDTLLRHADQAMCRAKEAGRNRFHVFAADNDRDARSRRDLVHRLRQALTQHELRLYYQPKVNLRTGEVLGVEALIRWQHPEQGLLPPAAFLNDLLDGDLEIDVGNWVIDEAIRQWCAWRDAGQRVATVSVNVSSHQLLKPGFVDALSAALRRHSGFEPQALQLEILESAAITEIDHAAQVMRQCLDLGVGFALDDFGTGYSSLSHFRRLPVDTLKIDQSFVRGMLSSPDDRGIVAAVVHMAKAFNRHVVAEGVETPAHGQALQELGCDVAQGYAIARPMPAADVPAWCVGWQHRQAADLPAETITA